MATFRYKQVEVAPVDGETFVQTALRVMQEQGAQGWRFTHYVPREDSASQDYFFVREVAD